MARNFFLLTLFVFLCLYFGCKPQGRSVSPDGARQILQLRGYPITTKGYYRAIGAEDLAAIRTFFQADFDPNVLDENGETPLTYAIGCCELKTVNAVSEKADLNQRNKQGDTALYLALRMNKREIFDLLLEKNADVRVPGREDWTVLHLATAKNDLELVKKLVARGADVNAVEKVEGSVPMMQACIGAYPHWDIIKFFLENGADVNHQGESKATCLMYAADNGHTDVVRELLSAGADPTLKDEEGHTALYWAEKNKRTEVVKLLRGK